MKVLKGYCKECGEAVYDIDSIEGYSVYECISCGHPSAEDELWETVPYYITKEDRKSWARIGEINRARGGM